MGAVLSLLVLATFGGMLYLALLQVANEAEPGAPRVVVVVATPEGTLFEGSVAGETPLDALDAAGRAANFSVARTGDGASLLAAAGKVQGQGGGWSYAVTRQNETLASPGPEGVFALEPGDRVRWTWTTR